MPSCLRPARILGRRRWRKSWPTQGTHRSDLCVIVAGYEQEMDQFLSVNPGLGETIRFKCGHSGADHGKYGADRSGPLHPEALALLERGYRRLVAAPPQGWANARSARQILDAVRTARAGRVGGAALSREAMTTLTEADVQAALAKKYPQVRLTPPRRTAEAPYRPPESPGTPCCVLPPAGRKGGRGTSSQRTFARARARPCPARWVVS